MNGKKFYSFRVKHHSFGELGRDVGENFIAETSVYPITTEFLKHWKAMICWMI